MNAQLWVTIYFQLANETKVATSLKDPARKLHTDLLYVTIQSYMHSIDSGLIVIDKRQGPYILVVVVLNTDENDVFLCSVLLSSPALRYELLPVFTA